MKPRHPLSDKERRFCQFLAEGDNCKDAYAKSGYVDHPGNGRALRRRLEVRGYLEKLRDRVEKRSERTAVETVNVNWEIVEVSLADFTRYDEAAKETLWLEPHEWPKGYAKYVKKMKKDPETGRIVEIELVSKDSAIDRIHKVYGLYEKDNKRVLELRTTGNPAIRSEDDIRQLSTEELKRIVESGPKEEIPDAEIEDRSV